MKKKFFKKIFKDNDGKINNHVNHEEQQNEHSDVKNIDEDDMSTIKSYLKSQVNIIAKDNNMEEYNQSEKEIETKDKSQDYEETKKSAIEGNAEAQNNFTETWSFQATSF